MSSVVDVLGTEVGPGRQSEDGQVTELDDEPAYYIPPQNGVTEQVDKGKPMSGRQERM